MITRARITQIATRDAVDSHVVERDYVLTHVIEAIGLLGSSPGLIFKGGTALRLCFFEDYRYSADLDFSLVGLPEADALSVIDAALGEVRQRIGVPLLDREVEDGRSRLIYRGPLGRERSIKLDLTVDELVEHTRMSSVRPRYEDQHDPPPTVATYTLEEMSAEKIRCILQRFQCRDFFDLHRLLTDPEVDGRTAWGAFERKAAHKGLDPARLDQTLDANERRYRERWEDELREHTPSVPHFDEVWRETRRELRTIRQ